MPMASMNSPTDGETAAPPFPQNLTSPPNAPRTFSSMRASRIEC